MEHYVQRIIVRAPTMVDPKVIDPSRIDKIPKGSDEILCIADALAHAGYRALEPHRVWKRLERSYFDAFDHKLWRGPRGKQNIHLWGFVLMPTDRWGTQFVKEYPWILSLRKT